MREGDQGKADAIDAAMVQLGVSGTLQRDFVVAIEYLDLSVYEEPGELRLVAIRAERVLDGKGAVVAQAAYDPPVTLRGRDALSALARRWSREQGAMPPARDIAHLDRSPPQKAGG